MWLWSPHSGGDEAGKEVGKEQVLGLIGEEGQYLRTGFLQIQLKAWPMADWA
jgi:hypothetical protein